MPRAEVGSTKYIANKMKSKGLQRLRWYCQACSRQMRDENGFKCHVASESHVRQMQLIGEDPRKAINDFSNQFQKDFVQLLRTGHGEKKVNINQFYQEYISNKEHIHMNATKWASLTEFAKYLGREGICRVYEDEKNEGRPGASALLISWIDNSPDALRRQEALKKKERQDRGDEEREQRLIQAQIRRARRDGGNHISGDEETIEEEDNEPVGGQGIKRKEGEKIVLSFGAKKQQIPDLAKPPTPPLSDNDSPSDAVKENASSPSTPETAAAEVAVAATAEPTKQPAARPAISMSLGGSSIKPKNVFAAAAKKNALAGTKKSLQPTTSRPMSEAERIMKEELERKRQREANGLKPGGNVFKKQRVA
ncbi:ubiquitin-conjugating enzyme E2 G2 [Capronia coronata CBS 617.96]|uniref:Ubiquitin-conjugating enzyme E2 G2 n=1 Tax=Capronia coronata CBS 617.96 TaxID=1182541 RepID=W9XTD8_9EURO|nr:ubiquitin-conjugating enzyme E2 G2 [Capronia coronata CBS 617.96]EXJ83817.1 ubiquitin-conjugating enzyme E2 G2 [Capronia coronata CBS 617.96]